ncbi:hypothetical protein DO73_4626 [Burkholderia pseudomallei]|nr:hypothetical protein DO73_4626 [Burkholderia pseudomallei]
MNASPAVSASSMGGAQRKRFHRHGQPRKARDHRHDCDG